MKPETPPIAETDESFDRINDYFYARGWTDGLPIVPPTEGRVRAMLAGMPGHDADELVAVVPPKMGRATMRQVAINAVMAGCMPEYLPVVVAALRAVSEPAYGLSHRQTTTHAGAPLIIVNGPIAKRLKINGGRGLFGPGWRANATIGRALRLVLVNVGGAGPDVMKAITEGATVSVADSKVLVGGEVVAKGTRHTLESLEAQIEDAKLAVGAELERFAENTLEYLRRERHLLTETPSVPKLAVDLTGRHVLVVVRGGLGWKEDLAALRAYIRELKPVLNHERLPLFEAPLPAAGFATPAVYEADGRQFVVVAAGGGKLGRPSGDRYVAFALPREP